MLDRLNGMATFTKIRNAVYGSLHLLMEMNGLWNSTMGSTMEKEQRGIRTKELRIDATTFGPHRGHILTKVKLFQQIMRSIS